VPTGTDALVIAVMLAGPVGTEVAGLVTVQSPGLEMMLVSSRKHMEWKR